MERVMGGWDTTYACQNDDVRPVMLSFILTFKDFQTLPFVFV